MQILVACKAGCKIMDRRLAGMVTRSKIGLLFLSLLTSGLYGEGIGLSRPSGMRIHQELKVEQKHIAKRKAIKYSVYSAGASVLGFVLLRDYLANLWPDSPAQESNLRFVTPLRATDALSNSRGRVTVSESRGR